MAGHQRFERMAVGHVLGGLDDVDAAAFRAHLLACRDCRKRVNELREIASDLAATEREERAAQQGSVELETRTDPAPPTVTDIAPARRWPWGAVIIGLVPLLVLGTLAWAVWIRAESDLTRAVALSQQQVLDVLATGEPVDWAGDGLVLGNIVTDGDTVAVNLRSLPELRPDEGLVVWLLDADGDALSRTRPYLPSQLATGELVVAMEQPAEAVGVLVSIEDELPVGEQPTGADLVTGPLSPDAPA